MAEPLTGSQGRALKRKYFPQGVAYILAESNSRVLLENGKIYAKHDNKWLIGNRGQAFEHKYLLR
jgi:hypothetical protein